MRRLCVLLVLLALLLAGCSSRFTINGGGYLQGKTDRTYKPLSSAFAAIESGKEIGTWENKKIEDKIVFFEIISADTARFLTDERGNVYCADEAAPDASKWSVKSIRVCDESAVSVAVATITDTDLIAQIRTLWHEGEPTELPLNAVAVSRRLKMASDDCPGIYYCVQYLILDDGTAYFYDRDADRTVLVGEALMKKIPIT